MKRYLLTWYGMTDLRSALGFEKQGPVAAALKTEQFDEVHILAYTKKQFFSDAEQEEQQLAIAKLKQNAAVLSEMPREESLWYTDILANTPAGHKLFKDWLIQQLSEADINVSILMQECFLKELSDTEGIYFSAVNALRQVTDSDADVTFFLSPGTPVMAFSWALAMLSSPKRTIKLLASSDFRRGLRPVELPETVLSHLAQGRRLA